MLLFFILQENTLTYQQLLPTVHSTTKRSAIVIVHTQAQSIAHSFDDDAHIYVCVSTRLVYGCECMCASMQLGCIFRWGRNSIFRYAQKTVESSLFYVVVCVVVLCPKCVLCFCLLFFIIFWNIWLCRCNMYVKLYRFLGYV